MKSHILAEFNESLPQLRAFQQQVLAKLESLLTQYQVHIHSVSSRIKQADSLARKLGRPDRTYDQLNDITDLLGVRIITYFEDTIEQIAELVEKHFQVDYVHSVDKRQSLDVSHFGYRSLHYICRLSDGPEQPCFELQIRTILQHAWAETEHDLGYKAASSVPLEIRRRFSRVASLLEIADAEFLAIKRYLTDYKDNVSHLLAQDDALLPVDRVSLEQFLSSPEATAIEQAFAQHIGVELSDEFFYPEYLIKMLNAAELTNLAHVRATLLTHQNDLLAFIRPYFEFTRKAWQFGGEHLGKFLRGYSLVFLVHFLIVRANNLAIEKLDTLTRFYQKIDYPNNEAMARMVAKTLLETLNGDF